MVSSPDTPTLMITLCRMVSNGVKSRHSDTDDNTINTALINSNSGTLPTEGSTLFTDKLAYLNNLNGNGVREWCQVPTLRY
jgi:hypothetical protein